MKDKKELIIKELDWKNDYASEKASSFTDEGPELPVHEEITGVKDREHTEVSCRMNI
jgi:hypothetical protein